MFIKFLKNNLYIILILLVASILRLYQLSGVPASLFGDEMDVGYHAYSMLKTGKDYQGNFLPFNFHSLAEWRTPLYLYSAVPTVAIFGITPLGVRLPAVIYGVLSILGFYLLVKQLKIGNKVTSSGVKFEIVASALLAVNPWHLQYSRAGFEVTMLLAFLLFGLYFFYLSLENKGKYLWLSGILLVLTPVIYSTAKFFTLFLLIFLIITYRKQILGLSKPYILYTIYCTLVAGLLVSYSVLFSGGSQRFNYISVFSDPTTESEIGTSRLNDARSRGETGTGLNPSILDRIIHNKFTYWGQKIENNLVQTLSSDFLFLSGDPNPRHSMDGYGMFFKFDFVLLLIGIIYFFYSKNQSLSTKSLVIFWIFMGILPSALTRDGGNHSTRLILILPPLMLLISYGASKAFEYSKYLIYILIAIWMTSFGLYLHTYYSHYPSASERWWHYGWAPAVSEIKKIDSNFEKVIITMKDEPAWVFFAGAYEYDPTKWQREYPIGNDTELNGFGKVSHTDKFYFGSPQGGIYELEKVIDNKTLYLASSKEVSWNLIMDPTKVPNGLKLIESFAYPSGEPAFYLFTKQQ